MSRNNFYFTIIDDTDDATLENIKPVYDFLYEKKIFITKTVWVHPPRDKHSKGDSLQRPEYLEYIKELSAKGFEIALHNVGSGDYTRDEILDGIEQFKSKLGFYPKIHINHSYNKDSIYGGFKRFNWPFSSIVKKLYPQYSSGFEGEIEGSDYFWGDKHKELIKYSRNHEFYNINTLKIDTLMPYTDAKRSKKYKGYYIDRKQGNVMVRVFPNLTPAAYGIMSKEKMKELGVPLRNSSIYSYDSNQRNALTFVIKK